GAGRDRPRRAGGLRHDRPAQRRPGGAGRHAAAQPADPVPRQRRRAAVDRQLLPQDQPAVGSMTLPGNPEALLGAARALARAARAAAQERRAYDALVLAVGGDAWNARGQTAFTQAAGAIGARVAASPRALANAAGALGGHAGALAQAQAEDERLNRELD